MNIATALGFVSRMCSLQSLERLESEHHLVTALRVESWPGVLQVTQKHIKSWKLRFEAEMGFPMSEAYGLPLMAKSKVGSVMANLCGSHYPLHMAMVEVSSQRVLIDKAFSVPKCVRVARMSHHSHRLLRKIRGTVPRDQRDDLSEIWGKNFWVWKVKTQVTQPLLEASGDRNLRSIDITQGNVHATVWHKRCGIRITQNSAWYGMWKKSGR